MYVALLIAIADVVYIQFFAGSKNRNAAPQSYLKEAIPQFFSSCELCKK
jgi:hypothetical protein